jgi:hypothetical protein
MLEIEDIKSAERTRRKHHQLLSRSLAQQVENIQHTWKRLEKGRHSCMHAFPSHHIMQSLTQKQKPVK